MTSAKVPSGVFAPVATIFGSDGELDTKASRFELVDVRGVRTGRRRHPRIERRVCVARH